MNSLYIEERIAAMKAEVTELLANLRAQGLTQRQIADLMGGPAPRYRFRQIATGKRLPDTWEFSRLRQIGGK